MQTIPFIYDQSKEEKKKTLELYCYLGQLCSVRGATGGKQISSMKCFEEFKIGQTRQFSR